jgi:hypothetical protein
MTEPQNYLVWSNEHRGWWKGRFGYAAGLRGAGRFTRARALQICREAIRQAPHVGVISEIPVRADGVDEFLGDAMIPAGIMEGDRPWLND